MEKNLKVVDVRIKNKEPFKDMRKAALNTINKKYTEKDITPDIMFKYFKSEHSPIRVINLSITLYNIPSSNAVHFARHVHSIPFTGTNRPDRIGKPRDPQRQVNHIIDINPQGLIDMARKRLCVGQVDPETYKWMEAIKTHLIFRDLNRPEDVILNTLGKVLVPNCVYRYCCPEFKSCNLLNKIWDNTIKDNKVNAFDIQSRYFLYNWYLYEKGYIYE